MSDTLTALGILHTEFEPKVVTATITSASADIAMLRTHAGETAIMPITEFYPNKRWVEGSTYFLLQTTPGPRPILSAINPELIEHLIAGLSPEIRTGQVRIMGIARGVGVRSKLAVAATNAEVDPIASVVGRTANRVKALTSMLHGERVDMVTWNADKEVFLRNALGPNSISRIEWEGPRAKVIVPAHQHAAVVGGGGLNALLASRLTGVIISVEKEERS